VLIINKDFFFESAIYIYEMEDTLTFVFFKYKFFQLQNKITCLDLVLIVFLKNL